MNAEAFKKCLEFFEVCPPEVMDSSSGRAEVWLTAKRLRTHTTNLLNQLYYLRKLSKPLIDCADALAKDLELTNISDTAELNLAGVTLTAGMVRLLDEVTQECL